MVLVKLMCERSLLLGMEHSVRPQLIIYPHELKYNILGSTSALEISTWRKVNAWRQSCQCRIPLGTLA